MHAAWDDAYRGSIGAAVMANGLGREKSRIAWRALLRLKKKGSEWQLFKLSDINSL